MRKNDTDMTKLTLGVIGSVGVREREGEWSTHLSFGRILNLLAPHFRRLIYTAKENRGIATAMDCALDRERIEVWPGPSFEHSIDILRRPLPLLRSYRRLIDASDVVFVRGNDPFSWYIHARCARRGIPVAHWLVSNPVALLKMESRFGGRLKDGLALLYTLADEMALALTARFSRCKFVVNGQELGLRWRRFNPRIVVSSTISRKEFREREDTCTGPRIRLLFVGFIRPEKGLEYLVRALPLVESPAAVELSIVGPRGGYPAEVQRIEGVIREVGWEGRVRWEGYATFGPQLFAHLDAADIFVLPTLSEGTPRVLVEARARGLPVVSTTVGGIPSSVDDGQDGLLVPPKDPAALAGAISRIINDSNLRHKLMSGGYRRADDLTVESFTDKLLSTIAEAITARRSVGRSPQGGRR